VRLAIARRIGERIEQVTTGFFLVIRLQKAGEAETQLGRVCRIENKSILKGLHRKRRLGEGFVGAAVAVVNTLVERVDRKPALSIGEDGSPVATIEVYLDEPSVGTESLGRETGEGLENSRFACGVFFPAQGEGLESVAVPFSGVVGEQGDEGSGGFDRLIPFLLIEE